MNNDFAKAKMCIWGLLVDITLILAIVASIVFPLLMNGDLKVALLLVAIFLACLFLTTIYLAWKTHKHISGYTIKKIKFEWQLFKQSRLINFIESAFLTIRIFLLRPFPLICFSLVLSISIILLIACSAAFFTSLPMFDSENGTLQTWLYINSWGWLASMLAVIISVYGFVRPLIGEKQIETKEKLNLKKQYKAIQKKLKSDSIDERVSGCSALHDFAIENKAMYSLCAGTLLAYLNSPYLLEQEKEHRDNLEKLFSPNKKLRKDIQTAVDALSNIYYHVYSRKERIDDIIISLPRYFLLNKKKNPARFVGGNFIEQNMSEANLNEIDLRDANLVDVNLQRANLEKTKFQNANLEYAALQNASLSEANLESANLQFANLKKANLQRANLNEINLGNAKLEKINLESTWLAEVDFSDVNLRKANFQGAFLRDAKFNKANLTKAILVNTELQYASFRGATLQGANLTGANIASTQLQHVIGSLTREQILLAEWGLEIELHPYPIFGKDGEIIDADFEANQISGPPKLPDYLIDENDEDMQEWLAEHDWMITTDGEKTLNQKKRKLRERILRSYGTS